MASPQGVQLTCKFCLNEQVRECLKCQSRYCVLHAAKFSPNFCKDCLSNLTAILEKIKHTSTEYDMFEDELVVKSVESKKLRIDGPDWIFYSTWIENLQEEDWLQIYQFHYFILKMMEHENELRKVKTAKRIASAPLSVKVTKESKSKKEVKQIDMQAYFEKIGIPAHQVKAMLAAIGLPYKERTTSGNNGTS